MTSTCTCTTHLIISPQVCAKNGQVDELFSHVRMVATEQLHVWSEGILLSSLNLVGV